MLRLDPELNADIITELKKPLGKLYPNFEDAIDDVVITSLEQSGYNLNKESSIVDNFIKVDDSLLVVTNNGKDWQIVFYQYGVYQEISFVNNEKNLLKILIQLLTEYNKR